MFHRTGISDITNVCIISFLQNILIPFYFYIQIKAIVYGGVFATLIIGFLLNYDDECNLILIAMITVNFAVSSSTEKKYINIFTIIFTNSFVFTYLFYRSNGFYCIITLVMLILAKIDIIFSYVELLLSRFNMKYLNLLPTLFFVLTSFGYWICDGFTYKKDTLIFCYILTMGLINIFNASIK